MFDQLFVPLMTSGNRSYCPMRQRGAHAAGYIGRQQRKDQRQPATANIYCINRRRWGRQQPLRRPCTIEAISSRRGRGGHDLAAAKHNRDLEAAESAASPLLPLNPRILYIPSARSAPVGFGMPNLCRHLPLYQNQTISGISRQASSPLRYDQNNRHCQSAHISQFQTQKLLIVLAYMFPVMEPVRLLTDFAMMDWRPSSTGRRQRSSPH